MNRRALFIVTSDPRQTGRVAEAVRIAAGVGAWPQVEVTLYLQGDAALVLGEDAEDLIDGENFTRYLPMLAETGRPILVQQGVAVPLNSADSPTLVEFIDDAQLAARVAASHCVLRF
jgi:sulfur relay (sulfurtransferase) DsrF/TusC family protein